MVVCSFKEAMSLVKENGELAVEVWPLSRFERLVGVFGFFDQGFLSSAARTI
jgi:hypothetical protein